MKHLRVRVYKNLHNNMWSIQSCETGRVLCHSPRVLLRDCTFTVRPAGREKVRRERRKNVHAFVTGDLDIDPNNPHRYWENHPRVVYYDPYKVEEFVDKKTKKPLSECRLVYFSSAGTVYYEK